MRVRQRCPVHRPCRPGGDPGRSGDRRGHCVGRQRRSALPGARAAPGLCRGGHDRQQEASARLPGALPPQAIKFYDHATVFRVETTINNPREFKVLRSATADQEPRWCPMTKGVANFWRSAEVAYAANGRLLTALTRVPLTGAATAELDALCQPVTATRVAAFNPIHPDTANLFAAVLSGDFTVNGFRNRDLQGKLYPAAATDVAD